MEVKLVELNGKTLVELNGNLVTRIEYCRQLGYDYYAIANRMCSYNISFEQAVKDYLEYRDRRKIKDTRLYRKWYNMKNRCENPQNEHYKYYGGKEPNPIKVCERWQDYFNFEDDMLESFLEHVEQFGLKDTTIERDDYDKDYCLENCSWKTKEEQANNRKNNTIVIDNLTIAQFSKKYNIPYHIVAYRLKLGWSVEKIINTPVKKRPPITILSTGETIPQFCKRTGMAETTVRRNLAKGKSIEEIENTAIVHYYLPCKNNTMPLRPHCLANNYRYEAIIHYINKYNLTPDKALARYLEVEQKKEK